MRIYCSNTCTCSTCKVILNGFTTIMNASRSATKPRLSPNLFHCGIYSRRFTEMAYIRPNLSISPESSLSAHSIHYRLIPALPNIRPEYDHSSTTITLIPVTTNFHLVFLLPPLLLYFLQRFFKNITQMTSFLCSQASGHSLRGKNPKSSLCEPSDLLPPSSPCSLSPDHSGPACL